MQEQIDTRDKFTPLACSDRALLQVIFLNPWPIFHRLTQPKSLALGRMCCWKTLTKWDFSRLLGQVLDWLSAVSRAQTCLEVLLHLSPEKEASWQEFCPLTCSLGKLGIFSVSMLRFDCGERDIDQQGARCWELSELAGVQHGIRLQKRLWPHC